MNQKNDKKRSKIKSGVVAIIRKILDLKKKEVDEDTLIGDIPASSMDLIEVVAVLSEKYKVKIEPQRMNNVRTVGEMVDYFIRNQKNN